MVLGMCLPVPDADTCVELPNIDVFRFISTVSAAVDTVYYTSFYKEFQRHVTGSPS